MGKLLPRPTAPAAATAPRDPVSTPLRAGAYALTSKRVAGVSLTGLLQRGVRFSSVKGALLAALAGTCSAFYAAQCEAAA